MQMLWLVASVWISCCPQPFSTAQSDQSDLPQEESDCLRRRGKRPRVGVIPAWTNGCSFNVQLQGNEMEKLTKELKIKYCYVQIYWRNYI